LVVEVLVLLLHAPVLLLVVDETVLQSLDDAFIFEFEVAELGDVAVFLLGG
jgi:hypothetical protein